MTGTKKLAVLSMMVSQALILSIIESWIPAPVGIPGVKLGLANIITLVVIIFFGLNEALMVVVVRCLLSSMFGGGLVIFLFSISGGVLSTLAMHFLYKKMYRFFSIVGISIAGAVMHNIGQIAIAIIIMRTLSVISYLPVLLISGIIMGCFVGLCTLFLSQALKKLKILT